MFSKALFKQSCKANGTMWLIITFAECFMLACVMLISGKGGIDTTIEAVKDTFVRQEMDVQIEARAINYYENQIDGMQKFDALFAEKLQEEVGQGGNLQTIVPTVYASAVSELQSYLYNKALAIDPSYTQDSDEAKELLGSVMYAINPPAGEDQSNGMFDDFYTSHGESVPGEYFNSLQLLTHLMSGDLSEYFASAERAAFIEDRAEYCSSIFLAGNMTSPENVERMIEQLEKYDISPEKYESLGYTYPTIKQAAAGTVVTYRARLESELEKLDNTQEDYAEKVTEIKTTLTGEIASSFLSLPR